MGVAWGKMKMDFDDFAIPGHTVADSVAVQIELIADGVEFLPDAFSILRAGVVEQSDR